MVQSLPSARMCVCVCVSVVMWSLVISPLNITLQDLFIIINMINTTETIITAAWTIHQAKHSSVDW